MNAISQSRLTTRFGGNVRQLRSDTPLPEELMRRVAPSIFASGKHASRSERYAYIPTIDVLRALREEGFAPFMVAQSACRTEGKAAFTKHMIRLRHASELQAKQEAYEIILINSHDGASAYQMLAGLLRFVCCNGLVVGTAEHDIRLPHKGNVQGDVIDGAFTVLEDFEGVQAKVEAMKRIALSEAEVQAFDEAALTLRYGVCGEANPLAPITAQQLDIARRPEDLGSSLWAVFNRAQENLLRGGVPGRTANRRRTRTRAVASIDRGLALNRGLWRLADEVRRRKG